MAYIWCDIARKRQLPSDGIGYSTKRPLRMWRSLSRTCDAATTASNGMVVQFCPSMGLTLFSTPVASSFFLLFVVVVDNNIILKFIFINYFIPLLSLLLLLPSSSSLLLLLLYYYVFLYFFLAYFFYYIFKN